MVYVKKGLLITIFLKKHHISNSFVRKLFIFPSPLRIEGMTEEKIHDCVKSFNLNSLQKV